MTIPRLRGVLMLSWCGPAESNDQFTSATCLMDMEGIEGNRMQIDCLLGLVDRLTRKAEKLEQRNLLLKKELVTLGHINCEWCRFWNQDIDSSDEGTCTRTAQDADPYRLLRIERLGPSLQDGQIEPVYVLKTLCNFGCKEGKGDW